MRKIKVAITDDHHMVADGIQQALNSTPDMEVSAVYNTGFDLLAGLRSDQPDVLLLDLQLPDKSGIDLAREVLQAYPGMRILILTGIDSPLVMEDLMKVGCRGYLLKTVTNKDILVAAIQQVHQGGIYLDPREKDRLLEGMLEVKQKTSTIGKKLTAREKDVLRLIVAEYTNQEIADRLYISLRTVENHRHNLLTKLDVKNAVGLVKAAIQMGLMEEK